MGDSLEITTWPKHQSIFYKVTSSALMFDVKAPANAAIGLAKKPGSSCDYWIGIGDNNRCWIKKDDEHSKAASTPNILNSEEYRRLWITWFGGNIRLGRDGESKPIISCTNKIPELNFVTFTAFGERNAVHWKFELPPVLEQPSIKPITGGKPYWATAGNQLPDEAMIGGYEKENLYIIRAFHRGSCTPGKFVPSEGTGYIGWGTESHEKNEFEVLCGFDCIWVPSWEDRIPVGAFEGGYSESHQERLYVGRAIHNGHLIPGKVQPSHKVCYITFEGKEIGKKKFEILVEPTHNMRCVNKMFVADVQVDSASESDQDDDYHNDDWPGDDDDNYYDSNEDVFAL